MKLFKRLTGGLLVFAVVLAFTAPAMGGNYDSLITSGLVKGWLEFYETGTPSASPDANVVRIRAGDDGNGNTVLYTQDASNTIKQTYVTKQIELPLGAFRYSSATASAYQLRDLNIEQHNNMLWHVWSNNGDEEDDSPLEAKIRVPDDYAGDGVFKFLVMDSQSTSTTKPSLSYTTYVTSAGSMPAGGLAHNDVPVTDSPDEATCENSSLEGATTLAIQLTPSWGAATGDLWLAHGVFEYTAKQ